MNSDVGWNNSVSTQLILTTDQTLTAYKPYSSSNSSSLPNVTDDVHVSLPSISCPTQIPETQHLIDAISSSPLIEYSNISERSGIVNRGSSYIFNSISHKDPKSKFTIEFGAPQVIPVEMNFASNENQSAVSPQNILSDPISYPTILPPRVDTPPVRNDRPSLPAPVSQTPTRRDSLKRRSIEEDPLATPPSKSRPPPKRRRTQILSQIDHFDHNATNIKNNDDYEFPPKLMLEVIQEDNQKLNDDSITTTPTTKQNKEASEINHFPEQHLETTLDVNSISAHNINDQIAGNPKCNDENESNARTCTEYAIDCDMALSIPKITLISPHISDSHMSQNQTSPKNDNEKACNGTPVSGPFEAETALQDAAFTLPWAHHDSWFAQITLDGKLMDKNPSFNGRPLWRRDKVSVPSPPSANETDMGLVVFKGLPSISPENDDETQARLPVDDATVLRDCEHAGSEQKVSHETDAKGMVEPEETMKTSVVYVHHAHELSLPPKPAPLFVGDMGGTSSLPPSLENLPRRPIKFSDVSVSLETRQLEGRWIPKMIRRLRRHARRSNSTFQDIKIEHTNRFLCDSLHISPSKGGNIERIKGIFAVPFGGGSEIFQQIDEEEFDKLGEGINMWLSNFPHLKDEAVELRGQLDAEANANNHTNNNDVETMERSNDTPVLRDDSSSAVQVDNHFLDNRRPAEEKPIPKLKLVLSKHDEILHDDDPHKTAPSSPSFFKLSHLNENSKKMKKKNPVKPTLRQPDLIIEPPSQPHLPTELNNNTNSSLNVGPVYLLNSKIRIDNNEQTKVGKRGRSAFYLTPNTNSLGSVTDNLKLNSFQELNNEHTVENNHKTNTDACSFGVCVEDIPSSLSSSPTLQRDLISQDVSQQEEMTVSLSLSDYGTTFSQQNIARRFFQLDSQCPSQILHHTQHTQNKMKIEENRDEEVETDTVEEIQQNVGEESKSNLFKTRIECLKSLVSVSSSLSHTGCAFVGNNFTSSIALNNNNNDDSSIPSAPVQSPLQKKFSISTPTAASTNRYNHHYLNSAASSSSIAVTTSANLNLISNNNTLNNDSTKNNEDEFQTPIRVSIIQSLRRPPTPPLCASHVSSLSLSSSAPHLTFPTKSLLSNYNNSNNLYCLTTTPNLNLLPGLPRPFTPAFVPGQPTPLYLQPILKGVERDIATSNANGELIDNQNSSLSAASPPSAGHNLNSNSSHASTPREGQVLHDHALSSSLLPHLSFDDAVDLLNDPQPLAAFPCELPFIPVDSLPSQPSTSYCCLPISLTLPLPSHPNLPPTNCPGYLFFLRSVPISPAAPFSFRLYLPRVALRFPLTPRETWVRAPGQSFHSIRLTATAPLSWAPSSAVIKSCVLMRSIRIPSDLLAISGVIPNPSEGVSDILKFSEDALTVLQSVANDNNVKPNRTNKKYNCSSSHKPNSNHHPFPPLRTPSVKITAPLSSSAVSTTNINRSLPRPPSPPSLPHAPLYLSINPPGRPSKRQTLKDVQQDPALAASFPDLHPFHLHFNVNNVASVTPQCGDCSSDPAAISANRRNLTTDEGNLQHSKKINPLRRAPSYLPAPPPSNFIFTHATCQSDPNKVPLQLVTPPSSPSNNKHEQQQQQQHFDVNNHESNRNEQNSEDIKNSSAQTVFLSTPAAPNLIGRVLYSSSSATSIKNSLLLKNKAQQAEVSCGVSLPSIPSDCSEDEIFFENGDQDKQQVKTGYCQDALKNQVVRNDENTIEDIDIDEVPPIPSSAQQQLPLSQKTTLKKSNFTTAATSFFVSPPSFIKSKNQNTKNNNNNKHISETILHPSLQNLSAEATPAPVHRQSSRSAIPSPAPAIHATTSSSSYRSTVRTPLRPSSRPLSASTPAVCLPSSHSRTLNEIYQREDVKTLLQKTNQSYRERMGAKLAEMKDSIAATTTDTLEYDSATFAVFNDDIARRNSAGISHPPHLHQTNSEKRRYQLGKKKEAEKRFI